MHILLALLLNLQDPEVKTWTFTLEPDDRVPTGESRVLGGLTTAKGTFFKLQDLWPTQPVQLTLATEKPDIVLDLRVYQGDTPVRPMREAKTDAKGVATIRFRTSGEAIFEVAGPPGKKYQLLAWVGKPIDVRPAPVVADRATFTGPISTPIPMPTPTPTPAPVAAQPPPAASSNTIMIGIAVLLGLILVALVVIAMILGKRRGPPAAAAVVLALLCLGGQDPTYSETPGFVSRELTWDNVNTEFQELGKKVRELSEWLKEVDFAGLGETAGGTMSKYAKGLPVVLALLEEFGILDPRENGVVPDFNPPGLPPLPIREPWDRKCGDHCGAALRELRRVWDLLEKQHVIMKQLDLKVKRITELADAAADWSPLAKTVWTLEKANPNSPINSKKEALNKQVEENYRKLIKMLQETLLSIGKCERERYNDPDWYLRFGLPFLQFMEVRYKRS